MRPPWKTVSELWRTQNCSAISKIISTFHLFEVHEIAHATRSVQSLRLKVSNKRKLVENHKWIKSRNCDVIGLTLLSRKSVRFSKPQIFITIFCPNSQRPAVWSRRVDVPPRYSNVAAGKLATYYLYWTNKNLHKNFFKALKLTR